MGLTTWIITDPRGEVVNAVTTAIDPALFLVEGFTAEGHHPTEVEA